MKSLLFYLLQVVLASGLLYGYYHLALRNKRFHQYNRFYLLAAVLLSIVLPFLNIPIYFTAKEHSLPIWQDMSLSQPVYIVATGRSGGIHLSTQDWLLIGYTVIALFFIIRMIFSLRKIRALIDTNPVEKFHDIRVVTTVEPGTPFSFFRWLFWDRSIELNSDKGQQVFRHEVFHIRQKHSADIIFLEIVQVVFWINPFFHLLKKELKATHEFLADQYASSDANRWEYAELLLMQALNTRQRLVNPFFHNQIKRRIAMITNPQKTSHQYLRKLLVLPVAALAVALFAFTYKSKSNSPARTDGAQIALTDTIPNGVKMVMVTKADQNFIADNAAAKNLQGENVAMGQHPLMIVNGKEYTNAEWTTAMKDQTVIAKKITRLSHDSKEATAYGPKAKDGVVIMEEASFQKNTAVEKPKDPVYYIIEDGKSAPKGDPMVVIDGKAHPESSKEALAAISPDKIQSLTVLKGESAIARYGSRAKDGVIEIVTKVYLKEMSLTTDTLKLQPSVVFDAGQNVPLKYSEPATVVSGKMVQDADVSNVIALLQGKVTGLKIKSDTSSVKEVTVVGYPSEKNIRYKVADVKIRDVKREGDHDITVTGKQVEKKSVQEVGSIEILPKLYPNPTDNKAYISLTAEAGGEGLVRVSDAQGKIVISEKKTFIKGKNNFPLNTANLNAGLYLVSVTDATGQPAASFRLVKE